ncbi:MAG: HAD-IC family P-type ATPase [Rhodocyclaceae bacterium]|nr:HAD-IC family P-type ATPase [Rhodocyclaceae bacterium]
MSHERRIAAASVAKPYWPGRRGKDRWTQAAPGPGRVRRRTARSSAAGRSSDAYRQGRHCVMLADESGWIAVFRLGDQIRAEAAELVRRLRDLGCHITLLSGDSVEAVGPVAAALAIQDAHGGMTPQGKHDFIAALQSRGAVVAMVGDGVNDAPMLAQAQVSVAMGGGTELARNQADIVLLGENLARLAEAVELARQTRRIVRQNLAWAFAYNLSAIPLAMLGWITPWMAGIGMSASSLLVVANALRLQNRGKN